MFKKILFYLKKPYIVVVSDKNELINKTILYILDFHFKIAEIEKFTFKNILKNNVLILPLNFEQNLDFFIKKSKNPILIVNEYSTSIFNKIKKLSKIFFTKGSVVLDFDNQSIREFDDKSLPSILTFGFLKNSDLNVSDFIIENETTKFKINYQGNIVPFWIKGDLKKKEVYAILTGISCALKLNLNLVEISQILKTFELE